MAKEIENAVMDNNGRKSRERKCNKWNSKVSNGGYQKQEKKKRKYNKNKDKIKMAANRKGRTKWRN